MFHFVETIVWIFSEWLTLSCEYIFIFALLSFIYIKYCDKCIREWTKVQLFLLFSYSSRWTIFFFFCKKYIANNFIILFFIFFFYFRADRGLDLIFIFWQKKKSVCRKKKFVCSLDELLFSVKIRKINCSNACSMNSEDGALEKKCTRREE